jgi:Predicted transcriptional regulator
MIKYKIDVMEALKKKGYTSTRLRNEKILPESTMTRLRNDEPIGMDALSTICIILGCQPSDVIEVVASKDELKKINK